MKRMKMRIEGDMDRGYTFVSATPVVEEKIALYIDAEGTVWLFDYQNALDMLNAFDEQCMSALMGKTEYIVIYPEDSAVTIDGDDYIMGECLIMKNYDGVQCMNLEEAVDAFVEYVSRVKTVYAGQYALLAYQV